MRTKSKHVFSDIQAVYKFESAYPRHITFGGEILGVKPSSAEIHKTGQCAFLPMLASTSVTIIFQDSRPQLERVRREVEELQQELPEPLNGLVMI
jgi:hypothetical protein